MYGQSAKTEPMVNKQELDATYGEYGNEFMLEIMNIFISEFDGKMEIIERAVKERDMVTLQIVSHPLKGNIGQFMDHEAYIIAKELNEKAKKGDQSNLDEVFARFKEAATATNEQLKELRKHYE